MALYTIYTMVAGSEEHCLAFTHVEKSGGSTIKTRLRLTAKKHDTPYIVCAQKLDPGCRTLIEQIKEPAIMGGTKYLAGHVETFRPALQEGGADCQWFTMLRHPIERLISLFFYCNNPDTNGTRNSRHCGLDESEEPLEDRLLDFARTEAGNLAVFRMQPMTAKDTFSSPINSLQTPADWRHLQAAQDRLATYVAIGIHEHWDLSMKLFDAKLVSDVDAWSTHLHINGSKNTDTAARVRLREWALTSVELNYILAADLLFYSYALGLFKQHTADTLGTTWS